MTKKIIRFFDKLEDKIRGHLSRYPLIYSLIVGVGVILFWRGIWHTADMYEFMSGPVSIFLGVVILGLTGVLVSSFIGNSILMTGLKGSKKLTEKTIDEINEEQSHLEDIDVVVARIEEELADIRKEIHHIENK
jgi:hypothetical protein